ncbi:MAG: kinase/pyrophosphorylase [Alphaproteobacteria bacterium]|nr:kinase/pyrophosphorylase [Alphaproteobacteria bacterium]MCB9698302.1 kinase/pyrophosphorylase [Alphaproteobacteria bacterium]
MPKPILVLSDGTGETGEKMVRAALQQFKGHLVHVRTYAHITRPDQLRSWFRVAARQGACVVTTLVAREMRQQAAELSREHGVVHLDLIEDLLGVLSGYLSMQPVGVPGLLHQADETYFRRIEAVEFTVKADDGKEPRMLRQADIILVGVSRTSKTPLSTYLAHKGFKVGNVPIVLDRPLPTQLSEVDPRRIMALTIDPEALQGIRRNRLLSMGMPRTVNYDDLDYILAELEYSDLLFRKHRDWPVIDVTGKAVEETAGTILGILHDRGLFGPTGDPSQL